MLRHLGLMFLAPATRRNAAALPTRRLGDLAAAVLAIARYPAVASNAPARPLVWLFNVEGTVDFNAAITLATIQRRRLWGAAY